MKRILLLILTLLIGMSTISCSPTQPEGGSEAENTPNTTVPVTGETEMNKTEQEYNSFVNHLEAFPVNFVYGNVRYNGFHPAYFAERSRVQHEERNGVVTTVILEKDLLEVRIEAVLYREYNAYDYTVYFTNKGTENSPVIEEMNAVDMAFTGEKPVLKGIYGDIWKHYRPYEVDLTQEDSHWKEDSGRGTSKYFPYFNLETDNGGAMLAIGWGGTWEADFSYDAESNSTRFSGTGTLGLQTYLKPGETIRTPLIGVVRYYERDEDIATNAWRHWIIDCNYPKDNTESDEVVQPFHSVMVQLDTGRPNSDGSISETYQTWQPTLDAYYGHGLTADYRWFDAGWYEDPYGPVESDWWGTVGTWTLDGVKWPDDTFNEMVDYVHEHGSKILMWFEPERVTQLSGLVANYGYQRAWVLSDHGNNNAYINNLGIEECLEWTYQRIISAMNDYNIDLYREDFNIAPGIFWSVGDGYQGDNRVGITENLYMQGHYELWDRIIEWCGQNGRSTYIDSCAAGGQRNDLETLRRGVPLNRSDIDRSTVTFRISITSTLHKWFPFTGAFAKDSATSVFESATREGDQDIYALRGTYLPSMTYLGQWSQAEDQIDWDTLRQGLDEWEDISKYFYKDYYLLTPYAYVIDDTAWTAWEYFDEDTDSGVIQAFRRPLNTERTYTVQVKGVDPDKYYTVRDLDGVNSKTRVKGSALQKGFTLIAEEARTAMILYIEPCQ